jgi:Lon protease-like protein
MGQAAPVTARQVGARAVIPLFPLGTVLVPGLVLPLHVFEPRYRRLVHDLQTRREDDRAFGVVAIREGREVGEHGVTATYDVGTLAVVREVVPYADGRFDLMTNGDARFRVVGPADSDAPYLMAEVEWLAEDDPGSAPEAELLAAGVRRRFEAYRAAVNDAGAVEAAQMLELPDDPRLLSYLVAVAMVLDLSDRQLLLEAATTADRLRREVALLGRETMLVRQIPSLPAVDLARTPSGAN